MQISLKSWTLFLCIFVVGSTWCWAQYTPYFQNYDLSQYNAGNQNWDISKAKDGRLYVANNNGLLEYDGLNWELYTIPNKTTLRSVLAHDQKIFIGSYEEFGFFEKNKTGKLLYNSLTKGLHTDDFLNQEFWQILPLKEAIVFRSFLNIYIYEKGTIKKITPNSTVMSCTVIDDELYVSTLNEGIFKLVNGQLQAYLFDEKLVGSKVVSLSKNGQNLLITTALQGAFLFDGKRLDSWNEEIATELKKYQANSFSTLPSGDMIFGTIQNGLYVTNSTGDVKYHINRANGLINNTILSQYLSDDGQLWVGLDNGISSIDLKSASTFYNDVSGKLGAVYDVVNYKGRIYIGSNTGLYFLDNNNDLQFIPGSQGQVWDLKIIEGDLVCGHNNGTFLVKEAGLELISAQTGGWVIARAPGKESTYIQGTYAGLVSLKKINGNWESKHLGKTTIPIRFLVFDDEHTAWAAHAYKGLYRIRFNENLNTIISVQNYEHKGLSSVYNVRVHKVKNDICIKTNDGWQKYEAILDSIVPHKVLNDTFGEDSYIISDDDTDALVLKRQDVISIKSLDGNSSDVSLESKHIKDRIILGYENVSGIGSNQLALNLNDGFMIIDKNGPQSEYKIFEPKLDEIKIDGHSVELAEGNDLEVPNRYKSLTLELSSPKSTNYHFEYAIVNIDSTHWYKVEDGEIQLSNLGYGEYYLNIRTKKGANDVSKSIALNLNVLPPWYKSKIGFLVYFILSAFIIVLFYYLHKRKINKEQALITRKYEDEQKKMLKEKTIENEKRIVELKNESLESEVELKSKQLANTAMALVKKNETLLELKNELVVHKSAFENYYAYKKLIKKIDGSIGHDDEWSIFEYNFNQVHQEFFNQIQDKHPNLTPKDLKICAYIKMDLSTKEIAPLMNISVRGVETQRYRLKQKLDLESDKSVVDYVRNFK
ncbi:LuxR C-terminal-related transcriptional regulator [Sediminibacter sp. Hel_I_10]|uniref:helix-turn-helix and ligand-binding sensor domain-containing protein n=1 Tax=Sediminibacter sp. Hel_I_10 TaxID=1392490 RepID=UPI0006911958|nr:LuxR C-terminal-related transcriptional regulator [Sediminibacter sp. Hel_I_10]